ncbi:MAG: helix-turn-helix transcriptional regulator [Lachnospiraceae bacterium]|nr:helix-turn-helix transcriptional regulator [Lachnospiraceae bacterium]
MDQIKIGKFIAACRKEKGYTQASLAEELGITDRAVSKWETGKSLPDSSIMLELCELLSINVNELLKGEHMDMEEYAKASQEIILDFKKRDEEKTRFLLKVETSMGILVVIAFSTIILMGAYLMNENHILGTGLILLSLVFLIGFIPLAIRIEQSAGYYQCKECNYCYVPTYSQVFMAPHYGRTRYMKCPNCGKRSYQKKMITKE